MLRGLWAFSVFVVATVACGVPASVLSLVLPRANPTNRAARIWSRVMLAATGSRVEYIGRDHAFSRLPCVYIANHQSNVDIWALLNVLPLETRFVAKQSLFRIPALGWAMSAAGFIPIDRDRRHKAMHSLRLAAERIRAGHCVLLFPEGTRSKDGQLQKFKKGSFHLALRAAVPVVPVAISGSGRVLAPGSWRVRPGPVRVRFLEPIDPAEHPEDPADFSRQVEQRIAEALARAE